MDAGDWISLAATCAALIAQSIGVVVFLTRLSAAVQAHTDAIKGLTESKVSIDVGRGYQAQLDRLERNDAECEGRLTAIRQEVSDRVERMVQRIASHEQSVSASMATVTTSMTRMEEGLKAVKESVDRLSIEERQHRAPQSLDIISVLSLAAQAAPLVRQLLSAEPQKAHA